jgi:hypothetical protein
VEAGPAPLNEALDAARELVLRPWLQSNQLLAAAYFGSGHRLEALTQDRSDSRYVPVSTSRRLMVTGWPILNSHGLQLLFAISHFGQITQERFARPGDVANQQF